MLASSLGDAISPWRGVWRRHRLCCVARGVGERHLIVEHVLQGRLKAVPVDNIAALYELRKVVGQVL